jgi:iturin family lipopeptide synthetase B
LPTRWLLKPRTGSLTYYELKVSNDLGKLLGLKQVGIYDNFFDLDGHSLHAVRLFEQIEKEFSQCLPLSGLF